MNTEYYTNKLIELHEELSDLEVAKADIVGAIKAPSIGVKSLDYRIRVVEARIEDINKRLIRQQDAAKNWELAHQFKLTRVADCEKNILELQQFLAKKQDSVTIGTENPLQIAEYVNAANEIRKERKELSYLKKVVMDSLRRKPTYAKIGTVRNPTAESIIKTPGTYEDALRMLGLRKPEKVVPMSEIRNDAAAVMGIVSTIVEENRPIPKQQSISDENAEFVFKIAGDNNA